MSTAFGKESRANSYWKKKKKEYEYLWKSRLQEGLLPWSAEETWGQYGSFAYFSWTDGRRSQLCHATTFATLCDSVSMNYLIRPFFQRSCKTLFSMGDDQDSAILGFQFCLDLTCILVTLKNNRCLVINSKDWINYPSEAKIRIASQRILGVLRQNMASSSNQEEGKATRKLHFDSVLLQKS